MKMRVQHLFYLCIILLSIQSYGIAQTLQINTNNTTGKSTEPETKPRLIPVSDFFKKPAKSSYQISPDGTKLAFMSMGDGRMNVFIQDINSTDSKQLTHSTDRDISSFWWGNDNTILYLKDTGGDENFHLHAVPLNTFVDADLTPFDGVTVSLLDDLYNDDNHVLIQMNKLNPQVFDVYNLDINTGNLEMVLENPGNFTGFQTDHSGAIRIAMATDGVNNSVYYRENESQPWSLMVQTDFTNDFTPLCFDKDNKDFYALSNLNRDKDAIFKVSTQPDLTNTISTSVEIGTVNSAQMFTDINSHMKLLYENAMVDLSGLNYSEKKQSVISYSYTTEKGHTEYLDDEMKTIFSDLQTRLTGYEVVIRNSDKSETNFIIRTYSDKSLGAFYLFNKTNSSLTKLADVSPWLTESNMCAMQPIKFTSRDGQIINGYLTLPIGVTPKNLPMIVNPHGGPWARNSWGFNPEVQFLANRGYAVLQINFRGSTGYGKKFWQISFKQWGQTMQNDITDGVLWAEKQGYADPKKVAIYGASYGGYATLAGLTYTPELYACGVDYVGVSNLLTFLKTIPAYWAPYLQSMYAMIGDPSIEKDSIMMSDYSPAFHADKINVPLFVAQGKNDPRVNINESNQIVNALKKRNIEVEYMVKDNEGHGFMNEENQIDFYTAMEAFLAKHLLGVQ